MLRRIPVRVRFLVLVVSAGCKTVCPMPIEQYCYDDCDDMQYWIDQCEEGELKGCTMTTCGEYQVLRTQGDYSGEVWYFDANGNMIGYHHGWEGDGPGKCGGGEYYGYEEYGTIPSGC